MNYSKECLYDMEWQALRIRMVGKWSHPNGVKQCLSMANNYWSPPSETGKAERIWRVLNLLNAVKLGYAQQPTMAPDGDTQNKVLVASQYLSDLHAKMSDYMGSEWDWNKVRRDMLTTDLQVLKNIRQNLGHRFSSAKNRRKDEGIAGVTLRRPELTFYLQLLDEELLRRDGKPIKCICKVVEKRSPIGNIFRGWRILVTTPNMAGIKPFTNERCISFERPYHIVSFGDYENKQAYDTALLRIVPELNKMGFQEVSWLTKVEEDIEC